MLVLRSHPGLHPAGPGGSACLSGDRGPQPFWCSGLRALAPQLSAYFLEVCEEHATGPPRQPPTLLRCNSRSGAFCACPARVCAGRATQRCSGPSPFAASPAIKP